MKSLFPYVKKVESKTIGDDIISLKSDEKWADAVARHIRGRLIKDRNLKIKM